MNYIKLLKKWSGQNRTSRTGSYTYVISYVLAQISSGENHGDVHTL